MNLRSVRELKVVQKPVLVRAEFNVPLENGVVKDDSRIKSVLPTLQYLAKHKAKIIIVAHLGRPAGWDEKLSLEPVAHELARLWERKLVVIDEKVNRLPEYPIPHLYFFQHNLETATSNIRNLIQSLEPGDAVLLENLRFYPGEDVNDPEFAKLLASLASVYVNEAFGASHRNHASVVGVSSLLPTAAGLGLEKEIQALEKAIRHPKKPVVVMMGGIKLSDKAQAMEHLAKVSDVVLLGGGLANSFLKVKGYEIGKSVGEEKRGTKIVKQMLRDYRDKIKLPVDVVVSTSQDGQAECVKIDKVKPTQIILDIGPATILQYSKDIKNANTLIWNGPMGHFEKSAFSHGTFALGRLFASRTKTAVYGVAGGGETLEVIKKLHLAEYIDHVSTGGAAMLEFLGGTELPGLKVLEK